MPTKTISHFVLIAIALTTLLANSRQADAQLLQKIRSEYGKIRSEYGKNTTLTYGPDDPSFRSRLFNLHTAHSGAYYNCDGEESKRHSPYIRWKTVHGPSFVPFLWDVRNWKADKAEVAQRICDGGCCGHAPQKRGVLKKGSSCSCCNQHHAGVPLLASNTETTTEFKTANSAKSTNPESRFAAKPTPGSAGLLTSQRRHTDTSPTPKPSVRTAGLPSAVKRQSPLTQK